MRLKRKRSSGRGERRGWVWTSNARHEGAKSDLLPMRASHKYLSLEREIMTLSFAVMAARTILNQERSSPTSIWAPRPTPTDVWNNTVFNEDSHQRRLSDPPAQQQQQQFLQSQQSQLQQTQQPLLPPKRSVGAIGDGRRPSAGADADSVYMRSTCLC